MCYAFKPWVGKPTVAGEDRPSGSLERGNHPIAHATLFLITAPVSCLVSPAFNLSASAATTEPAVIIRSGVVAQSSVCHVRMSC